MALPRRASRADENGSERKIDDLVGCFFRRGSTRYEFKVVHAAAYRDVLLMRINDGRKVESGALPTHAFREKIRIAGENDPPERSGAVEQLRIQFASGAILLRC